MALFLQKTWADRELSPREADAPSDMTPDAGRDDDRVAALGITGPRTMGGAFNGGIREMPPVSFRVPRCGAGPRLRPSATERLTASSLRNSVREQ
jgi:hypothetical protein